ncbi:MAG: aminotransferase class V-fold PLP-dependent enzyme [Candidatus Latescibacterota bacterium]
MRILLDVHGIRKHFLFPQQGRIVTNNAASTQPPVKLLDLCRSIISKYENVHRGQSTASREMTGRFEKAYDTVADFINAPGRKNIVMYRNTTEAINSVMYSLLTEFRPGDNVVTTRMEHNSNYVPWYGMCREILPRLGVSVEYRIADFNRETGELDLEHLAGLVDRRTKMVCCTGASNFLGTKNPIRKIREIANASGYEQPNGEKRSYLLVDGAQLAPSTYIDVQESDVDFFAFSMHKILAPFGVGVLYVREPILESSLPFLYGGDMIAEGQVSPEYVGYNALPWKYTAGTPNILGTIMSAQSLRLLLDLAANPEREYFFNTERKLERDAVREAMACIHRYTGVLVRAALENLAAVPGITLYGPRWSEERTPLIAFNVAGWNPMQLAEALNEYGVESRAGCHCATLAHYFLGLDPPASCRLSFYIYNTLEEVRYATESLAEIVTKKTRPKISIPVLTRWTAQNIPSWIARRLPLCT